MGKLSITRALAISLALVLLAVLGLWWATSLSGPLQTFVSSVASATLSIGALSLVYEVWMREQIHRELIELVGIERSTARSRLKMIASFDEFAWGEVFDRAKTIRVLLSNPDPWLVSHFPAIVEEAARRRTEITILLPDVDGRANEIAEYHGQSEADFAAMLSRSARGAEETWKNRRDLVVGSSLEIRTHKFFCAATVIETEGLVVTVNYPPAGSSGQGINNGVILSFDRALGSFPAASVSQHLGHVIENSVIMYANKRAD